MERDPNESQILEEYIEDREQCEFQENIKKKQYLKQNILDLYSQKEEQIDAFLAFFLSYLKKFKAIDTQDHNLDYLTLQELKELVR